MKNYMTMKALSKLNGIYILLLCGMSIISPSCVDDSPDTISTFTKDMMGEYLKNHPENFSEFNRLLDTTEVKGLVNAYGEYTLFAPNNDAMRALYASRGRTSLNQFPLDSLKIIAYDHLIKGYILTTDKFIDGLMPYLTMGDRFLETSSEAGTESYMYYVNEKSAILNKNILVNNGVIHMISKVIIPSSLKLSELIAKDKKFKLFNEALVATKLVNKIQLVRDNSYDRTKFLSMITGYSQASGSTDELPDLRRYGYTALMESDSTYENVYNIKNLDDLKAYAQRNVYNEDPDDANVSDITDSRNSLNKFIAYHLINRKLPYVKFIDMYDTDNMIKTYDMYEYIETMNPNTLLEVKKERISGGANFFNKSPYTGESVKIVSEYKDKDAINGVYHEINKILIYDRKVAGEMSSKRLRIDAASFFPEFANNNMRVYNRTVPRSWVYPPGYLERLTFSKGSYFSYSNAFDGYQDYQSDEIFLKGLYDFEIVTPAIPAGTYEVRFGYQPTGSRGVAQLYWDHKPCGIPLNLSILADNALVGWADSRKTPDDPMGYENDKMIRNRGYMKGPCTYKDANPVMYHGVIARFSPFNLRRILGTYTFPKSGTHIFTVKGLIENKQFMLDYLEFVPVEMVDKEDTE